MIRQIVARIAGWFAGRSRPQRSRQPTFAHAFTDSALNRAWRRVRANAGAAGGDGVTIAAFARRQALALRALRTALLTGRYRPGPLRRLPVPKASGGFRELAIPCVVDRVAQTAWLMALSPALDPAMSPASFAYRPARSVRQALSAARRSIAAGNTWVVDADIRSFFDQVPHAALLADLKHWVHDDRLLELAALWVRSAARGGRGLPQGSPISPILANIYLDPLDRMLAADKVAYVRYADDFVALCRTRRDAHAVLLRIERHLRQRGLMLHPDKTRVRRADAGIVFLGETLATRRRGIWIFGGGALQART